MLLVIRQKPFDSSEVNALSITQPIKEQVGIVCQSSLEVLMLTETTGFGTLTANRDDGGC